jgi:hypothetical protein
MKQVLRSNKKKSPRGRARQKCKKMIMVLLRGFCWSCGVEFGCVVWLDQRLDFGHGIDI